MRASFRSFGLGLLLSVLLLYLILVAQFRSFVDPFVILLALPPALGGVILTLLLTGTTLNVMSLMGIVMLTGVAMSNSILMVEFANHLLGTGVEPIAAIVTACRVRLRPILMTSLATVIGLLPMALKLGEGSEAYAPLARGPRRRADRFGDPHGVSRPGRLRPHPPPGHLTHSGWSHVMASTLSRAGAGTPPPGIQEGACHETISQKSGSDRKFGWLGV